MKGERIPDTDHVLRYCRGSAVIPATGFMLRSGEPYLSVNWLEFLQCETRTEAIEQIRRTLSKKMTLGATGKLALLNVGNTRQYVLTESADGRDLTVLHEPEEDMDESHSGIYNTRSDNEMLIAELIADTIVEDYPAR